MTRAEHLLTMLAEEACEVAHRASKALRFGLTEVQPGQKLSNAQRISEELVDLATVGEMLAADAGEDLFEVGDFDEATAAKRAKVEKFLRHSAECGTLGGGTEG